MNETILTLTASLDGLAATFAAYPNPHPNLMVHGWAHPALTKEDFVCIITDLSTQIKERNIKIIDNTTKARINLIPEKIDFFKNNTLQYVFNGNGAQAVPVFFSLIAYIKAELRQYLDWNTIDDAKSLPPQMAQRLQSLSDSIDLLVPDFNSLKERVDLINSSFQAATTLPTNISSLNKANEKIRNISISADKFNENIKNVEDDIAKVKFLLQQTQLDADKTLKDCEETLHIATSKSLAGAFQNQVDKLEKQKLYWTITLALTLVVIGWLGFWRGSDIINILQNSDVKISVVIIDIFISISVVGAPIWFAWIATKQVKQLFQITEDYRYKLSVARSYEGFRKAAVKVDPAFANRLFEIALNRIDESPLRLVPVDMHSSPLSEAAATPLLDKILTRPDEKTKV